MGGAESPWKVVWGPLALLFVSSGLGWCPPKWIPYRDEFCLYLPAAPALSWKEARAFCQDQKADLVVIKDYSKQMFLRDHTEGARGHASYFWIGLAWREAQLTWVDGTPISQSWYSHWLQGHPGKKHCTQLVGIYAAQWRDWDCEASTSFICEKPMKDAFSSSTRKVRFRSHCYVFHFPSLREQRSWGEAQSFCQELGGNLAVIHDEEENTFLSSAFPEDGWYLWIGLHLEAMWKWSDASAPTYLRWHSDVHCLHSRGWRPWKDRCLFFVLDAALEWSQAQRFCQRFHGGSLLSLNSPQDLMWLQGRVPGSLWTGLHSSGRDLWSWLDGTRFNQALKRFMFFLEPSSMAVCVLALTSGFLKAEPCHRPHRWICQAPRQSDLYMTFPGKSFVGTKIADLSFPSLQAAKQQCSALGEGCDVVVSTMTGHHLMVGKRFVALEDPGAAAAAVHVKTRCSPGYSGQDCQSMCPRCEPSLSCNPLTGLCDGFLYYREAPALVASLKCLPPEVWIFERGSCWSYERYSSRVEAEAVCKRYLGSTVRKVPPLSKVPAGPSADGRRGFQQPGGSLWACQRGEDVKLPSFREKLLLPSHQEAAPEQRHASWQEAQDACYLQKERCTGLLSLKGAHYTVAGTVLVDSPGSGALLSVKAACSPGFCGKHCQRRSSPCLSTHTHNPLTGRCDGSLSCVRRFSPSCLHGLVHSRCPRGPGWWFWGGHCYYVEEQGGKSWQEAKAACQAYGENVTLLVLSSAKEKAWVAAMVQRGSWTGLSDAGGVWRWEGGRADSLSPPWLPDVPLVSGGCLEIRPRGDPDLAASPCSHLRPWVCEGLWAPLSSCPAEPGWSHWNGSCYLWDSSSAGAWPEALEACRRFRKTELLYLTSLQEMDWVRSHFQGTFWTGLNDRKEESVFRWSALEPLSKQVAQYLRDDMANGGRKDCVWFDSATGLLSDASCGEERPFLCKCPEATEWFDQWTGYGMVGEPSLLYPSAETLEGAKRECLLERPVCVAVLETRSGFYLLSSKDDASPKADSVLHVWTICAEGFSGLACRKTSAGAARPACDCSGTLKTTAEKVCGVPVQTCVEDCQQRTPGTNCSFCIPVCTEASLSFLDSEEFALVTMIQFKVSHSLNLTAEDERDRTVSSKVVYDDTKYP